MTLPFFIMGACLSLITVIMLIISAVYIKDLKPDQKKRADIIIVTTYLNAINCALIFTLEFYFHVVPNPKLILLFFILFILFYTGLFYPIFMGMIATFQVIGSTIPSVGIHDPSRNVDVIFNGLIVSIVVSLIGILHYISYITVLITSGDILDRPGVPGSPQEIPRVSVRPTQ